MASAEQIQSWLAKNQDKAGTPDFVTMTEELAKASSTPTADNRGARAPAPAAAAPPTYGSAAPEEPFAYTDVGVPIGGGTGAGAGGDPNSTFATAGRVGVNAITGIPDILTAIGNAAVRASGPGGSFGTMGVDSGVKLEEAPYLGQIFNRTMGVPEMDPKAGLTRRLLEGGGSALLGGGINSIVRNVSRASPELTSQLWQAAKTLTTNVAAPTAGAEGGGAFGEWAAKKLNLDPQTGALLGSLLGGSAPGAAPGVYDRYSHNWYADRRKANAPEIDAAMTNMGGEATPGQLGNNAIQQMERTLGSSIGAKQYIDDRRQAAHTVIGDAMDRAAEARGMTAESPTTTTADVVTPGTIGERLSGAMRDSAEGVRAESDAAQARLMDRVGTQTPVPLRPVQEAGRLMQLPGTGIEPSMRANIAHRLGPAIEAMLFRRDNDMNNPPLMFNADGTPLRRPVDPYGAPRGVGDNGGPPLDRAGYQDPGSVAAPYADVRAYRTELGRNLDLPTGQRLGPAAQLYQPVTEAMRSAAERQGVPRQDFENVQGRTQQVETMPAHKGDPTGDYNTLMDIGTREPAAAYDYLGVNEGMQNPGRLGTIEATQHPEIAGIMGDIIRQIGNETINNPNLGAAGPRQLATALENMHPESQSILYGDQAGAMNDVATGARAYNYPTSQTGLNRATGTAADRGAATQVIADALSKMGGPAGLVTLGILPLINRMRAGGLNSPQAMNALRGGEAPLPSYLSTYPADLAASLNAASASNDRRQLPPRP